MSFGAIDNYVHKSKTVAVADIGQETLLVVIEVENTDGSMAEPSLAREREKGRCGK